jgi:hypothetical protein
MSLSFTFSVFWPCQPLRSSTRSSKTMTILLLWPVACVIGLSKNLPSVIF